MLSGSATAEGTSRFTAKFPEARANQFYRDAEGLKVSSLGLGSYLGKADDETDVAYYASVIDGVRGGINFFDCAINYRNQRSERVVGSALRRLVQQGDAAREEFVVATKAGFLTPGAVPSGLTDEDVVRGIHCLHPTFLKDQVARSRENLGLATIDIHYLHNPETQLASMNEADFTKRMRAAFEALEQCCQEGWVNFYGVATWDGFRRRDVAAGGLQLDELVAMAREVAGHSHRFRFVQLPFNLGMAEAFSVTNQRSDGHERTLLDLASELGMHVVSSASILQSRLARNLPGQMHAAFPDAQTDAQRAIQFARSAPGILSALVGMSNRDHVAENLGVAGFAPMPPELYRKLF